MCTRSVKSVHRSGRMSSAFSIIFRICSVSAFGTAAVDHSDQYEYNCPCHGLQRLVSLGKLWRTKLLRVQGSGLKYFV